MSRYDGISRTVRTVDLALLSRLARVLADPRRLEILRYLQRTPATVNELSVSLGLRPSTTSRQLARLRDEGLVRSLPRGRHRIYSADPDSIAQLLEVLGAVATRAGPRTVSRAVPYPRRPGPDSDLRRARTCYDHLAGVAGVELASRMEQRGWIVHGAADFLLTEAGERQLLRRGVDVRSCREARRRLAPGCLDWTERQPHIGGALGAALLENLSSRGFLERAPRRRVRVRRPIAEWIAG
jgi:DNA-binding transcriptional ArsR family regulator